MLLLVLFACGPSDDSSLLPTDSDSGGAGIQPPCDGTWGWMDGRLDPLEVIHVAELSAVGDGSMEAPFGSLPPALELAREVGAPAVMIWPGTHDVEGLRFSTSSGDLDGFALCGCGAESELVGSTEEATIWISDLEMTVAGLALREGGRGLVVRGGAEVRVEEVSITDSRRTGIIIDGSGTSAELVDVQVTGVVPDEDIGYGLAVQGGQVVVDNLHIDTTSTGLTEEGDETGDGLVVTGRDSGSAPETFSFTMSDSTVTDSARAGVLLDGVAATLEGNTLSGSGLEVDESGILIQGGAIADGSDEVANVSSELGLNIQVLAIELVD